MLSPLAKRTDRKVKADRPASNNINLCNAGNNTIGLETFPMSNCTDLVRLHSGFWPFVIRPTNFLHNLFNATIDTRELIALTLQRLCAHELIRQRLSIGALLAQLVELFAQAVDL